MGVLHQRQRAIPGRLLNLARLLLAHSALLQDASRALLEAQRQGGQSNRVVRVPRRELLQDFRATLPRVVGVDGAAFGEQPFRFQRVPLGQRGGHSGVGGPVAEATLQVQTDL